jgi:hypothetical protein
MAMNQVSFHATWTDSGLTTTVIGIPLDDQALMYLCSVADHSASDRILVTSHPSSFLSSTKKGASSIYNISTNALSTPELGHSPSDTSSLTSPCAIRYSYMYHSCIHLNSTRLLL